MFARRFQSDFLESRCSSCHPHLFILGLILAYFLSSHVQAFNGQRMCRSKNETSKYQHCRLHPDGVHDLDCFGRIKNRGMIECVWKPGNHTSEKIYTLLLIQKKKKEFCNITESSIIIKVFEGLNMTVTVFENGESEKCTKAVFSGSWSSLLRCDPPYEVSFRRRLGNLHVNVSWQQTVVKHFSVRYKVLGSLLWTEPPVQSHNKKGCTVENLNSSVFYTVQIQCVTTERCSQCPWSETYTVPSELTAQPAIVHLEDSDITERTGSRLLSLHWKFPATESYDGYYVTIAKASGEDPCERMNTTRPEIRLILSFSSYRLNISAWNNASISPAVSHTIPQREDGLEEGKLNVTVHSDTSLTVYWKDDLIKTYVCFSAEWMRKRHHRASMSFYQKAYNWRTLSSLQEPLEPYKRYSLMLHTRPNKDTCNIKYINRSESTYGTTQFYSIQGSPVSAPNISICNMTRNSVVLQWSSIPEDDIRGFLLGYMIHYTEYHHRETYRERNITVDPQSDTCELGDLEGGTAYQVQISGFTQAGAGVRSTACIFKTKMHQGYSHYLNGYIIPIAVVAAVLFFTSIMIKRAKVILWPSIPNPLNSNAMQKIAKLELLDSLKHLNIEESTDSLQIVEKEALVPPNTLASVLVLLHEEEEEEEGHSPEMTWVQSDIEEHPAGDIEPDHTTDNFRSPPCAFSSDYTTMEMFQQQMPQGSPANPETDPQDTYGGQHWTTLDN
ncbi:interleukin-31 receptor subunit alpha isoform X2 [Pleuronectes platessa]|uniref:interleukin-31 receptor subunit alpha isoform X2 n=1 Tax=Pleuronectes platessa TaxID=8262 RepID=UPI00232A4FCE|nr:interleukin-31 receptor subunit alpha isoform X2 [Pleuronectes platessa]